MRANNPTIQNLAQNQRMSHEQTGGKLLGQGVYGCAFNPALKCRPVKGGPATKKGITNNQVGKITTLEDADNEYKFSEKLLKAPNASSYFLLATELCVPESRSKQTEKDLSKCEPLKGVELPSMAQLVMPLGGKPLRLVPRKMASIDFFRLGQHLLEAGALLLMKHVVHGDLHQMNVLLDTPRTARMIDFGLAWSPDELTLANVKYLDRSFNPAITQEPPEVSYIHGLLDKRTPKITLARISDEKIPLILLYKIYGISKEKQMKRLETFVRGSKSFQENNRYGYYKLYWNKVDAWGLGTMLLSMYVDMLATDSAFERAPELLQKEDMVKTVLLSMCDTEPALRMDAIEALSLWAPNSAVLQNPEIQSWLAEQRNQRKELERVIF